MVLSTNSSHGFCIGPLLSLFSYSVIRNGDLAATTELPCTLPEFRMYQIKANNNRSNGHLIRPYHDIHDFCLFEN